MPSEVVVFKTQGGGINYLTGCLFFIVADDCTLSTISQWLLGPVCTAFSGFGFLEFYSQVGERGLEETPGLCVVLFVVWSFGVFWVRMCVIIG